METTAAVLVDAFATEPTGGLPVAVLPDGVDLTDEQLHAATDELAADVAVPADDFGRLRVVGPDARDRDTPALVGAFALAHEHGDVDPGDNTVATSGEPHDVTVEADGRVWVDLETRADEFSDEVSVDEEQIAGALGVDVAALRDVGGDLPPTRIEGSVDTLAVAVNFLEHLGSLTPDPDALTALADTTDVDAVCAYTFDTLTAESACHARTFRPGVTHPRTNGLELPVAPQIAGTCVDSLVARGTVETDTPAVEQGHFLDRPARVDVRLPEGRVGGRAVTSLAGTVTLPSPDEDDIIEV